VNHLIIGDLVQVLHPGFSSPPLGVVIEQQDGTHLFRVMLLGEENNRIFRYSSTILRKVSDPQEPPRINS
jgi:hypothetical protein